MYKTAIIMTIATTAFADLGGIPTEYYESEIFGESWEARVTASVYTDDDQQDWAGIGHQGQEPEGQDREDHHRRDERCHGERQNQRQQDARDPLSACQSHCAPARSDSPSPEYSRSLITFCEKGRRSAL